METTLAVVGVAGAIALAVGSVFAVTSVILRVLDRAVARTGSAPVSAH